MLGQLGNLLDCPVVEQDLLVVRNNVRLLCRELLAQHVLVGLPQCLVLLELEQMLLHGADGLLDTVVDGGGELAHLWSIDHVRVECVQVGLFGAALHFDGRAFLARLVLPAREVVGALDAVAHRLQEELGHLVGVEVEGDVGHGEDGFDLEKGLVALGDLVIEFDQVVGYHLK